MTSETGRGVKRIGRCFFSSLVPELSQASRNGEVFTSRMWGVELHPGLKGQNMAQKHPNAKAPSPIHRRRNKWVATIVWGMLIAGGVSSQRKRTQRNLSDTMVHPLAAGGSLLQCSFMPRFTMFTWALPSTVSMMCGTQSGSDGSLGLDVFRLC